MPSEQVISILDDDEEVLFRQIHPKDIDKGEPSSRCFTPNSAAFRPLPKDHDKLSVDRGSLTSAEDAYNLFIANGFSSDAVYGVSVGQFKEEEVKCYSDPIEKAEEIKAIIASTGNDDKSNSSTDEVITLEHGNHAHALADFSKHNKSKQKKISKRIKNKAIQRGILFKPNR